MSGQELPAGPYFGPQPAQAAPGAPYYGQQPAQAEVAAVAKALRGRARRMALAGLVWLVLGLAVSIGSYLAAPPGGTYTVMWGAAVFGAYRCVRGLYYMADPAKLLR